MREEREEKNAEETKIDFYLGFSFALLYIYIQLAGGTNGRTDGHTYACNH